MSLSFSDLIKPIFDGGWIMFPLFFLGLAIYGAGFRMLLVLFPIRAHKVTDEECREWTEHPENARGQLSEVLRYAQDDVHSLRDIQSRFEEIRLNEMPAINVNITTLGVLVNAAPLLGLLGTVLGMLTTFQGLAMGGSEQTTTLVADGIRVALITTEMGLILAIPGTFLVYVIRQMRNSFMSLLVRLENVSLQKFKEDTASA